MTNLGDPTWYEFRCTLGFNETMYQWQKEELTTEEIEKAWKHEDKVICLEAKPAFASELIGRKIISLHTQHVTNPDFYEGPMNYLYIDYVLISKQLHDKIQSIFETLLDEPEKISADLGGIYLALLYLRHMTAQFETDKTTKEVIQLSDSFRKRSGLNLTSSKSELRKKVLKQYGVKGLEEMNRWEEEWKREKPSYEPMFTEEDYLSTDYTRMLKVTPAYNLYKYFSHKTGQANNIKALVGRLFAQIGLLPDEDGIRIEIEKKIKAGTAPQIMRDDYQEEWFARINSEYSNKIKNYIDQERKNTKNGQKPIVNDLR